VPRVRRPVALVALFAATLACAPAAAASPGLNGFEREVIRGVNQARAAHGLAPLRAHRGLSRAADRHSGDMLRADFFDHPSSDGTPFHERVRRHANFRTVGETLAMIGQRRGGAATVVRMWLESASHREIVLGSGFERIGVGRRWGRLGGGRNAVVTADFGS
jgi:uncharacterized protein YkwD